MAGRCDPDTGRHDGVGRAERRCCRSNPRHKVHRRIVTVAHNLGPTLSDHGSRCCKRLLGGSLTRNTCRHRGSGENLAFRRHDGYQDFGPADVNRHCMSCTMLLQVGMGRGHAVTSHPVTPPDSFTGTGQIAAGATAWLGWSAGCSAAIANRTATTALIARHAVAAIRGAT